MGKIPRPGRVKTRLVPPLSPEEAARLYEAFLTDVFELVDGIAGACRARPFWFVGLGSDDRLEDAAGRSPEGWAVHAQVSGDLGHRMDRARCSTNAERVVVIGSDSPTMPSSRFGEAFEALRPGRVVVGPTEDGGYDLIGLSRGDPAPFQNIPWSTSEVLVATRTAARGLGLELVELSTGYDLDRSSDLVRALQDMKGGRAARSRRAIEAVKERLLLSAETD